MNAKWIAMGLLTAGAFCGNMAQAGQVHFSIGAPAQTAYCPPPARPMPANGYWTVHRKRVVVPGYWTWSASPFGGYRRLWVPASYRTYPQRVWISTSPYAPRHQTRPQQTHRRWR